jgi:hypothetical protein
MVLERKSRIKSSQRFRSLVKRILKMSKIEFFINKLVKEYSGEEFFDKLDEFIRLPKNVDIIQSLFNSIYKENNNNFNVVISGKFGEWIKFLVDKNILKINGNLILVKSSLRLKGTNLT